MKLFQRILSWLSFFFLVMLLFLLLFQDKVSLPPFLQVIGRMHPLILHLPIGLLAIVFIIWLSRKNFEEENFRKIFILILKVTTFNALLAALMGFFLSQEGGYEKELLTTHKYLGLATAIMSYVLLWLFELKPTKQFLFGGALFVAIIIMIIGSYFGADLTHGEGFVFQPMQTEDEELPITDSSTVYEAAIRPILKSKCFSCHNERKSKGGLVMTSFDDIIKGGKHGPIWIPGDAFNSHIIQNINLPEEEKKHMPPSGKPQLSDEEVDFLYKWIELGANMEIRLNELSPGDSLKILATEFIPRSQIKEKKYPFAKAPISLIKKITGPFCNVFPISQNSPALQADFFVREKFDHNKLKELSSVKEQLVVLNLNSMPVTDEDMKTVSQFSNLEKLYLNNSSISNEAFKEINKLKNLSTLSVTGTKIGNAAFNYVSDSNFLKEIFIWNTAITEEEIIGLEKKFQSIKFDRGYIPDKNEILQLTPPIPVNEEFLLKENEKAEFKNPISGTTIRYTTDGTDPDSTSSPVYNGAISINSFSIIKTIAVKTGWYCSPVSTYTFFKRGFNPGRVELINQPNEKYKGKGAAGLTDLIKGEAENYSDKEWMGFREKPMEAIFYFDTIRDIKSISVSYNKNIPSYLFPPEMIEVWGGNEKGKLNLLKKEMPKQPGKEDEKAKRVEGIKIDIPDSRYKMYKIRIKPISKLPPWHPGKGDRGWVFIDEIFFN